MLNSKTNTFVFAKELHKLHQPKFLLVKKDVPSQSKFFCNANCKANAKAFANAFSFMQVGYTKCNPKGLAKLLAKQILLKEVTQRLGIFTRAKAKAFT